MAKIPSQEILRELGKKYLKKVEDKELLGEFLELEEIKIAQVYLLGFIHRALGKQKISMVEAYEDCERLGISPEEAIAIMDEAEEYLRSRRTKH